MSIVGLIVICLKYCSNMKSDQIVETDIVIYIILHKGLVKTPLLGSPSDNRKLSKIKNVVPFSPKRFFVIIIFKSYHTKCKVYFKTGYSLWPKYFRIRICTWNLLFKICLHIKR